jgi:hypothetical protein
MALKAYGKIRSLRSVINVRLTEFKPNLKDRVYETRCVYGVIKKALVQKAVKNLLLETVLNTALTYRI